MWARTGMGVVLLVTACSAVDSDWSTAQSENSVAGYQSFLEKHLNGHQADEAWARLGLLLDDQDWQAAQSANTTEGYRHYLQLHPNGAHMMAAEANISLLVHAAAAMNRDHADEVGQMLPT
ncbi:MAG: hypothetical protein WA642_21450 [Steroidobacteraceae bacterium]